MKTLIENKRIIHNVDVVTGNGSEILKRQDVYIEGAIIKDIRPAECETRDTNARIIDLTGKTIIPGLIDCHVHICMDPNGDVNQDIKNKSISAFTIDGILHMKQLLENGITYFRSMGDPYYIDIDLSKAREADLIAGPHFIPSGKLICMTGGHGWSFGREADGPAEIRRAVREQLKAGAGHIKLMSTGGVMTLRSRTSSTQLGFDELAAGVKEAHNAGVKTAAHAQGNQGIKNAVLAGIDSIEHGFYLDEEIVDMMKERGTYYVPTLSAVHFILQQADKLPDYIVKKTHESAEAHKKSFQLALHNGVEIALGTDAGTPFNYFGSAREEMQLMIEYGMSPAQALRCSTKNAAELLGISDQYGCLEKNKHADFIILNENPLINPKTLLDKILVYKDGIPCN